MCRPFEYAYSLLVYASINTGCTNVPVRYQARRSPFMDGQASIPLPILATKVRPTTWCRHDTCTLGTNLRGAFRSFRSRDTSAQCANLVQFIGATRGYDQFAATHPPRTMLVPARQPHRRFVARDLRRSMRTLPQDAAASRQRPSGRVFVRVGLRDR